MNSRAGSQRIHVIGAGLIGTSIALCLREHGHQVSIEDLDEQQEALARDLLKSGLEQPGMEREPAFIFVSVPPTSTGKVVVEALKRYPASRVIDVASTKNNLLHEVQGLSDKSSRFIPSHPIAGRETNGAASGQADLFKGRAWIITPHDQNDPNDLDAVRDLIASMGATTYLLDPEHHDKLFALISHLPQILSSAMASLLDRDIAGVELAGQGFRDVTRLADSDFGLWNDIIATNRSEISKALDDFSKVLDSVSLAIREGQEDVIRDLFSRGKSGKSRISGKHGGRPRRYSTFRIVIDDRPGVLGELFSLCSREGINIEDLDLEHSPNQETGLISLAVKPEQSDILSRALEKSQWIFHLSGTTT